MLRSTRRRVSPELRRLSATSRRPSPELRRRSSKLHRSFWELLRRIAAAGHPEPSCRRRSRTRKSHAKTAKTQRRSPRAPKLGRRTLSKKGDSRQSKPVRARRLCVLCGLCVKFSSSESESESESDSEARGPGRSRLPSSCAFPSDPGSERARARKTRTEDGRRQTTDGKVISGIPLLIELRRRRHTRTATLAGYRLCRNSHSLR